ncbi:hypothetical protein GCM10023310_57280 [Paenibacillus vulneris]
MQLHCSDYGEIKGGLGQPYFRRKRENERKTIQKIRQVEKYMGYAQEIDQKNRN